MGTLTVRENLNFSAALRLPAYVSQKEKEQKVNKLIEELGLGRVADSRVRRWQVKGNESITQHQEYIYRKHNSHPNT